MIWQPVTFNTVVITNGWTTSGTNGFICNQSGIYLFVISGAVIATGGARSAMLRGAITNVGIQGSQIFMDIQSTSTTQPFTRSYMRSVSSGERFTVEFAGNSTSVQLIASSFSPPASTPTSAGLIITRIS